MRMTPELIDRPVTRWGRHTGRNSRRKTRGWRGMPWHCDVLNNTVLVDGYALRRHRHQRDPLGQRVAHTVRFRCAAIDGKQCSPLLARRQQPHDSNAQTRTAAAEPLDQRRDVLARCRTRGQQRRCHLRSGRKQHGAPDAHARRQGQYGQRLHDKGATVRPGRKIEKARKHDPEQNWSRPGSCLKKMNNACF